jgi:hypothetical protein
LPPSRSIGRRISSRFSVSQPGRGTQRDPRRCTRGRPGPAASAGTPGSNRPERKAELTGLCRYLRRGIRTRAWPVRKKVYRGHSSRQGVDGGRSRIPRGNVVVTVCCCRSRARTLGAHLMPVSKSTVTDV